MNKWQADGADRAEAERFSLETDTNGDLDEALKEAVEAVEAVERDRGGGEGESEPVEAVAESDGVEGAPEDGTAALRDEVAVLRERSTRTLADFDNYRKRVEREKQAQLRYDGMEVLRGLLDIVDNLERALESEGDVDDLKAGVELTLRQANGLLQRHHVEKIEAEDATFDPTVHEAVARQEEEGLAEPRVSAVLQSGYLMHDRLLRPVRVAVAVPPIKSADSVDEEV